MQAPCAHASRWLFRRGTARAAAWHVLLALVATLSVEAAPAAPAGPTGPNASSAPAAATIQTKPLRARLEAVDETVQQNDFAGAAKALDALIREIEAAGDRALLVEALMQLGFVTNRLADYEKCFTAYRRAYDAAKALGDRLTEGRALLLSAQVRKNTGDYPDALRISAEARSIFEAIGNRRWQALSWQVNGAVLDLMGEYRDALDSYERARALMDEKDAGYGRLLNEIGITHKNLGNYAQADALYRSALAVHVRRSDSYGRAVTLHNLGILGSILGNYEMALEHYGESLAIAREGGDLRGQSILLGNIGDARLRLGNIERAIAAFQEQLDLARAHDIRYSQVLALQQLAAVAFGQGNLQLSRERYNEALEIERESGSHDNEPSILVALSAIELGESRPDAARERAGRALALAREAGNPEDEWRAHLAMAHVARAEGSSAEALRHLQAGVTIVNSVRGRVLTDRGKIGYFDARQDLYHELVGALVERKEYSRALEAAEAARGRALSDLLASRVQGHGADRERLAGVREAEARLRAQAQARPPAQARSEPTPLTISAMLTRTRAAEAAVEAQVQSLRESDRELASLVVADPVSTAEIQATARRLGATLVEYLVTRDRLLIWLIHPSGEVFTVGVAVQRDRLREVVRSLHDRFNTLDSAALRDSAAVRASLHTLHQWTIEPVAAHLPRQPEALVYLVPHDALLLVPFAALEDRTGRSVVQMHTVVTAPSVAVLRYTAAKKRPGGVQREMRVLALADPTPPPDAALEPLPGARAEVGGIRRSFPGDRVLALVGAEASEANAKGLSGAQSILHFAVHGLIRDDRPWESALVLSPGRGEDGWLRVEELFDLELQADLVVLSGCSTGAGRVSGDGVLGLARALTYAGAPSLLVSHWDVSDVSTAYLMDRFYEQLAAGRSKAQSLRAAQLATRERYPHPALWAAFVLVGEAQ